MPVMCSSSADYLCMSGKGVCKPFRCVAKVEMESTAFGAFFRTIRHEDVNLLASEHLAWTYSNDGDLIRVSQGMTRKWVFMDIFRGLRRMQYNPILAFLVIARLAEVN